MTDRAPAVEGNYDDAVAKRLLATTTNEFVRRSLPGRTNAGNRLVGELVRVANGYCEWITQAKSRDSCLLTLPEVAQLSIRHDGEGVFIVRQVKPTTTAPRTVRLYLNPETGLLEGKGAEKERAPVLGEMRAREDGLAVLLRIAIEIIQESVTEGE